MPLSRKSSRMFSFGEWSAESTGEIPMSSPATPYLRVKMYSGPVPALEISMDGSF